MENNFNDICLWIQAESINDNDIVIMDGQIIPIGDEYQKLSTFVVAIKSEYERIGEIDNVKIYQIPDVGYMIMSNLANVDKVNRKRAFSTIIKRQNLEDCWTLLSKTLQAINLSCNEADHEKIIECFREYNEKKKKLGSNIMILLTTLAGLFILLMALKKLL